MKIKNRRPLAAAGAAMVLGAGALVVSGLPAIAEPASSSQYVIVGSETIESAVDGLANGDWVNGYQVLDSNGESTFNYGAFGSGWIQTREFQSPIIRPQGSGNGRTALYNSINGLTLSGLDYTGRVDIARSSSGPRTPSVDGDGWWVPFARDAVSYAYIDDPGTPNPAWANLDAATLELIYECDPTTISTLGVRPFIPQSGSGTRSFFLGAIGGAVPDPSCVQGLTANNLPENDGRVLSQPGDLILFSASQYIAQNNLLVANTTAGVKLGSAVTSDFPYTGSAPNLLPDSSYYASAFGRTTFLVADYERIFTAGDTAYASLFDPMNPDSFVTSAADDVKENYGFLRLVGGDRNPFQGDIRP